MNDMFALVTPCPHKNPKRRAFSGAPQGDTLANGRPDLAMMKDSPAAALSTSRGKWVLASWMLIVSMATASNGTWVFAARTPAATGKIKLSLLNQVR